MIFGAGGQTGSGGVTAATAAGKWGIGVDQDEYFTTFDGGDAPGSEYLASSAIKRVDYGVFFQILQAIKGEFAGGIYVLTAENGGITYAPFHDADVPEDVPPRSWRRPARASPTAPSRPGSTRPPASRSSNRSHRRAGAADHAAPARRDHPRSEGHERRQASRSSRSGASPSGSPASSPTRTST